MADIQMAGMQVIVGAIVHTAARDLLNIPFSPRRMQSPATPLPCPVIAMPTMPRHAIAIPTMPRHAITIPTLL